MTGTLDRLQAAWLALTARQVIVVTKGFQFSTFNNSSQYQDNKRISIEVTL